MYKDVVLTVKTLARPKCLERLLVSIKKYHPDLLTLVADDSSVKYDTLHKERDKKVIFLNCEVDLGSSACRNIMLRLAKHKKFRYFVYLDDDFYFKDSLSLGLMYNTLENFSEIDMLGGRVWEKDGGFLEFEGQLRKRIVRKDEYGFRDLLLENGANGIYSNNVLKFNMFPQFFMARTNSIDKVQWDPYYKTSEHEEFFIRCKKKGLQMAVQTDAQIYHWKVNESTEYAAGRNRAQAYRKDWMRKNKIDRYFVFGQKVEDIYDENIKKT